MFAEERKEKIMELLRQNKRTSIGAHRNVSGQRDNDPYLSHRA